MTTFAVIYTYGNDDAARDEFRPVHKDFLETQYNAKSLLASGPINDDKPGALLIMSGDSRDDVADLMDRDPFMQEGLIANREIREWNIFFGGFKDN